MQGSLSLCVDCEFEIPGSLSYSQVPLDSLSFVAGFCSEATDEALGLVWVEERNKVCREKKAPPPLPVADEARFVDVASGPSTSFMARRGFGKNFVLCVGVRERAQRMHCWTLTVGRSIEAIQHCEAVGVLALACPFERVVSP